MSRQRKIQTENGNFLITHISRMRKSPRARGESTAIYLRHCLIPFVVLNEQQRIATKNGKKKKKKRTTKEKGRKKVNTKHSAFEQSTSKIECKKKTGSGRIAPQQQLIFVEYPIYLCLSVSSCVCVCVCVLVPH